MTLPHPELDEVEPYPWPRGTCPRCGSRAVVHHIFGMPDVRAMDRWPKWVSFEGCLHEGFNRSCRACRATWVDEE